MAESGDGRGTDHPNPNIEPNNVEADEINSTVEDDNEGKEEEVEEEDVDDGSSDENESEVEDYDPQSSSNTQLQNSPGTKTVTLFRGNNVGPEPTASEVSLSSSLPTNGFPPYPNALTAMHFINEVENMVVDMEQEFPALVTTVGGIDGNGNGDSSSTITIHAPGLRYLLIGNGRHFEITGTSNIIYIDGEDNRVEIASGHDNVIYYRPNMRNEIIAEGQGNVALQVENAEGEGQRITSWNISTPTNGLHIRPLLPQPPTISASEPELPQDNNEENEAEASVVPPDPEKEQSSGLLQRWRNWTRGVSENNVSVSSTSQATQSSTSASPIAGDGEPPGASAAPASAHVEEPSTSSVAAAECPAASSSSASASAAPVSASSHQRHRRKRPGSQVTVSPSRAAAKISRRREANTNPVNQQHQNRRYQLQSRSSLLWQSYLSSSSAEGAGAGAGAAAMRTSPPPQSTFLADESEAERRRIIAQQNEAFEATLKADREKEEKRERERQEKLRIEEEKKAKAQALLNMKEEARQNLPDEPVRDPSVVGGGDNDIIALHFRLPISGTTFQRNFRNTDNLEVVFQYVFSRPETPTTFHIIRRPREIFTMAGAQVGRSLQEIGFSGKEALIIENGEPEEAEGTEGGRGDGGDND